MLAGRFLRVPLAFAVTSSPTRIPGFGRLDYFHSCMKLDSLKFQLFNNLRRFSCRKIVFQGFGLYAEKLRTSGCKLTIGSMVVCSAIGSVSLWSRISYCADGSHMLANHSQTFPWDAPRSEERSLTYIIRVIHKIIVPFFLILTIYLKWGQCHPLFLVARILLIFLCTKPIPSSVHIFVDQLQRQIMSQKPSWYPSKQVLCKLRNSYGVSSLVNKVEVEDYTLLCLARVYSKDEKLVLIGILGSWWILPLSSSDEIFLFNKLSWKELINLVTSRFNLDARTSFT